jgi:hypothetical protein
MLSDLDAAARPTLLMVEAARLLDGDLDTGPLARDPEREATRLTVYVGSGRGGRRAPGASGGGRGPAPPRRRRRDRAARRRRHALRTPAGGRPGAAREVPTMVVAVGAAEPVAAGLAEVRDALDRPVATLERVHVWRRSGTEVAAPAPAPPGRTWQRLSCSATRAPATAAARCTSSSRGACCGPARRGRPPSAASAATAAAAWSSPRWSTRPRHAALAGVAAEVTEQAGLVTVEHVPECRPARSAARA